MRPLDGIPPSTAIPRKRGDLARELAGPKRRTDRGTYVDSHRATCAECVWSDSGGDPEPLAVAHVLAFGHDVTVSHIRIDVVSLRPKGETTP